MKNFREYLQESLNSPYKWEWKNKTSDSMQAHFKDSENRPFIIGFIWYYDMCGLSFGFDTGKGYIDHKNTGFNDSLRVLSTVLDVLKAFIKTNPTINEIRFSGSETDGKAQLYKKMLKHFKPTMKRLGFELRNTGTDGFFVIQKVGN